ncbi:lytic transglycosylase domain-containing protein [Nostocoides sp. HKS02]|uniref:lytic transglycosylase domain-containing protein n=1 Tax=Nostocoides sp. HKS02 TaxID=1813880 RepID=UPI001E54ED86|nr:lytic murein transglycosylase [Tetrasphaera sp. HKS02]
MKAVTRQPWRTIAAGVPAIALIGAGVALATTGVTPGGTHVVADSKPLVTVPSAPLAQPEAPTLPPLPAPPEQSATSFAAGPAALPSTMTANGIPALALAAYQRAASLVDAADPGCKIDWALIAAIGKVESNHGRYGGNGIDKDSTVRPGIFGIPLNGANSTAVIHDTDNGVYDHDTTWDRAVGPMQFIPSTWQVVGVDANGDGKKDPQNISDAAAATAVYLCSGPGDLSTDSGARSAVLRYNQSDAYAAEVLAIAAGYRGGYTVEPASALTPDQRNGSPFLPSGDPQTMAQYNPAVASQPASSTKPAAKPSAGSGSKTIVAAPGTPGSGTGSGGTSAAGTGSGSTPPAPSVGGVVGGVVGGLTGGLTGGGSTPTPTPAPSPSPSSTPTPAPTPTLVGPLKIPTCPTPYVYNALTKTCVRL